MISPHDILFLTMYLARILFRSVKERAFLCRLIWIYRSGLYGWSVLWWLRTRTLYWMFVACLTRSQLSNMAFCQYMNVNYSSVQVCVGVWCVCICDYWRLDYKSIKKILVLCLGCKCLRKTSGKKEHQSPHCVIRVRLAYTGVFMTSVVLLTSNNIF